MGEWLFVVRGPAAGQRVDFEDGLVLGRDAAGSANLGGDTELSRRHAQLRRGEGGWVVEDLGSTNGTAVNGRRIEGPRLLHPGDIVELGGTVLELREDAPVAARPAPVAPPVAPGLAPVTTPTGDTPVGAKPGPQTKRGPLTVILGALLAAVAAAFVVFLVAGDDDDDGTTAATAGGAASDGTLYTLSNGFGPDNRNALLAYSTNKGRLRPTSLREYSTGGTGSINQNLNLAIDGEQEIFTNEDRTLMFVVNQGSDSIAVFRIASDGSLTPVKGSPFKSGGVAPIGTAIAGETLVVVNKGQDGVRRFPEAEQVATVTQHKISGSGALTPVGESIALPSGTNPTQPLLTKDGKAIVISLERGDAYVVLKRQADGTFAKSSEVAITDKQRDEGLPPPPQIQALLDGGGGPPPGASGDGPPPGAEGGGGPPVLGSVPEGAIGIAEHPKAPVIYSGLPTFSVLMVHEYDANSKVKFVRALPVPKGFLICWTKVSADGRFLYTSNTGDHTVSVFDVSDPRNPKHLESQALPKPGGAASIQIDEANKTLYAIDHFDPLDMQPGDSNRVHALKIGGDGLLAAPHDSIRYPVNPDQSPIGLLYLPRDDT